MKERAIKKPLLDTSKALKFASESSEKENISISIDKNNKTPKKAVKGQNKGFSAPEGDKRLTINIKEDLHKRLKFAALKQDTTVGEIIEQLVESNL